MPGFVTTWVVFGLTESKRAASQYERTVEAFIFTALNNSTYTGLVYLFDASAESFFVENKTVCILGLALAFGVLLSVSKNTDGVHKVLRWGKLTKKSSFDNEWMHVHSTRQGAFIRLVLNDGTHIEGYPSVFPPNGIEGHYFITHVKSGVSYGPVAPNEAESDKQQDENEAVDGILVPLKDVKQVVFLKPTEYEKWITAKKVINKLRRILMHK